MISDDQPSQPLTDAELSALRDYIERTNHVDNLRGDARRLLAEVDRLRAALTALGCNEQAAANRSLELQEENSTLLRKLEEQYRIRAENARLRTENADQAAKLAHFEEQHQPVTVDWSASPKCKTSHGSSWVNWPCPDAFVLGMTEHGKAPGR